MKYPYGTVHYMTDTHAFIPLTADFSVNDFVIYGPLVNVRNSTYSFSLNTDRLFEPNYFGKKDFPIRVRHVCLKFVHEHDLPSGYKFNSVIRVPILRKSFYDIIKIGDLGMYARRAIRVIGKVNEKIYIDPSDLLRKTDV